MRAGVTIVPLDLRMSSGAIERIVARADAATSSLAPGATLRTRPTLG